MHPLALTGHRNGANGMKAGDRVRYVMDGRTGVADEFLHDGDTFITWDDGTFGMVKWNHLEKVTSLEEQSVDILCALRMRLILGIFPECWIDWIIRATERGRQNQRRLRRR